jgi:SpoVK/Ycf46/Vps4 family AAA+-type ATPase
VADVERLLMLFRAFRERDETAFYKAAESLIGEELAANHHGLARDLQDALGQPKSRRNATASPNSLSRFPKDRRSGEQLVSVQERPVDTSKLILSRTTQRQVQRVVDERRNRLKLAKYGYHPKSKLLFWGPPGCGKTLTAHALAEQLNLPLSLVRLSALISSFLGDTASHLQRVFDLAKSSPMVLLLDEIDAVGKNRDDSNDVGELKRVVNGLLQAMDSFFSTDSLVVGASNHQYLLDPALWRRFDDVIFFPMPGANERSQFLARLLNGVDYSGSADALAKKLAGLSYAHIERVLVEAVKTMILEDRSQLTPADITAQLRLSNEMLAMARARSQEGADER